MEHTHHPESFFLSGVNNLIQTLEKGVKYVQSQQKTRMSLMIFIRLFSYVHTFLYPYL